MIANAFLGLAARPGPVDHWIILHGQSVGQEVLALSQGGEKWGVEEPFGQSN